MPNNISQEEIAKYVDLDSGLGRVRGNKALYKRMLDLFAQSEEYDAFEKALSDNDTTRASEVMHSIKGMSGNLSLTRIYELSSELTNLLRNGTVDQEMIDDYRKALEMTRTCIEEVMPQLV